MAYTYTSLWLFVALVDLLALALIAFLWRHTRKNNPSFRLRLSLADLLAATLGFSPTMAILAMYLKDSPDGATMGAAALAILVPNQIAGILLAILRDDSRAAAAEGHTLQTSLLVLGGALLGMSLPIFTLTFFCGILAAAALFVALLPITIPMSLLLNALPSRKNPASPDASKP